MASMRVTIFPVPKGFKQWHRQINLLIQTLNKPLPYFSLLILFLCHRCCSQTSSVFPCLLDLDGSIVQSPLRDPRAPCPTQLFQPANRVS